MRKKLFILSAIALLAAGACSKKAAVSVAYDYKPELIGMEYDGSVTMRVWGKGSDRKDAIEQAHKEAVHAVIFDGVTANGKQTSLTKPLVLEPNAQDKYRSFFNAFFADGGAYSEFATKDDAKKRRGIKQKSKEQIKYGVTVRVLRSDLERYLIDQGILKQ